MTGTVASSAPPGIGHDAPGGMAAVLDAGSACIDCMMYGSFWAPATPKLMSPLFADVMPPAAAAVVSTVKAKTWPNTGSAHGAGTD